MDYHNPTTMLVQITLDKRRSKNKNGLSTNHDSKLEKNPYPQCIHDKSTWKKNLISKENPHFFNSDATFPLNPRIYFIFKIFKLVIFF
jgi:hypothetical protein